MLRKAERKKAKLRIGLSGPSGSGKSIGALKLAKGIVGDWSKIAVIDTENGSADLYSHLGEYNIRELLPPYSPERFIEAIKDCENAGMEIIIIDSVTHEWDGKGGCLEINDSIAQTKFKGNTWSAWSTTTPRHQKFIEAITSSPCHIITTARSKTDTVQNTVDGKTKVVKLGMKDIQREGFEYELTIAFGIDREGHYVTSSKDRTGMFIDRDPFVIDESTGEEIRQWNESGKDPGQMKQDKMNEAINKINESLTIQQLVDAFNHAKAIREFIGDDLFDALVMLKDEKKQELAEPTKSEPVETKNKPEPKKPAEPAKIELAEAIEQKQQDTTGFATQEQIDEIFRLYVEGYQFDEATAIARMQSLATSYKVDNIAMIKQETADSIISAMKKKLEVQDEEAIHNAF